MTKLRGSRRRVGLHLSLCAVGLVCFWAIGAPQLAAADGRTLSSQLSDQAFALLDSVSARHEPASPLLGPVGVFAADSQKLSKALQAGDRQAGAVALAALQADARAVDSASGSASGGFDSARWNAIKRELGSLAAILPARGASSTPSAAAAEPDTVAASASPDASSDLAVNIESAAMSAGDVLRLKGLIRGRNIRSAGIYLGENRLARLDVKPDQSPRVIRFDLEVHRPTPGSVIRVYDSRGHSAQAEIMAGTQTARPALEPENPPTLDEPPPAIGGGGLDAPSSDSGGESASIDSGESPEASAAEENTKEIPAAVETPSGPKRRMRSHLSVDSGTSGSGAAAASPLGIGPLVINPLVINPPTANQYGVNVNPNQLAVQITSVQPAAPSLYIVSGLISGRDLASAGLYQNGVLVQPLSLGGGGVGGLISGLIPGVTRRVPFVGRFNPAQGFATVRVFDRGGMMTEQPVMAAGMPYGPSPYGYGGVNPYMRGPYTGVAPGVGVAPFSGVAPGLGTTPGRINPW